MGWFHKKSDPISDRARALNAEIAALEAKIRTLDGRLQRQRDQPQPRSTGLPTDTGRSEPGAEHGANTRQSPRAEEPIFEALDQEKLHGEAGGTDTPEHYNELGVRKYDLPALLQRVKGHLQGPSTTNPKLVSYLAAGGIQGLRPLRYEKRVARNRFIVLALFLFLVLLGLLTVYVRR